jgi:hypothetical protein
MVHSHVTPLTLRYLIETQVSYLHKILLYHIVSSVNTMIITINDLLLQLVVTHIGHLQVTVEHTERFLVAYCSYMKLQCGMCTQIQHLNDNHINFKHNNHIKLKHNTNLGEYPLNQ